MRIIFRSNIDHYNRDVFPTFSTETHGVPRIGESVFVKMSVNSFYAYQKLPVSLKVVDVEWLEDCVCIGLHYKEIDLKRMALDPTVKPFG